ncbi:TPA: hypothetical protein ACYUTM_004917 [Serratia marcescens]
MELIKKSNVGGRIVNKNSLLEDGENTCYFKNRIHEIAFYFKENNQIFDKYLGIKKVHIVDKRKANDLRKIYLNIFHPDKNVNVENDINFNKVCDDINNVFKRLTGGEL